VTIAELQEDRVVEAVYAVRMKRKLRTKSGAAYLALELVDPTGRVEARVWNDVELLDGRFAEGDAVRVLARVEKFRDRLQLDVRSLEAADVDPQTLTPALRCDRDELGGFLDFLVAELTHPGLRATVEAVLRDRDLATFPATSEDHHSYAGGLLEHTVGVATLARETAQLHPRLRGDLLLSAALVHDVGRTLELGPGPAFSLTAEGRLLGHVHLGLRLIEERAEGLAGAQLAELLHCVAVHHDARGARTAEASVLYHANQLDAVAATRKVD
jgi:3'-5' exoribonuclease